MHGRPVLATDVGGNAEIIQDGVTGFVAEAATVTASFSKALDRAWQAQSRWPAMGKAARKYIRDHANDDPAKALLKTWIAETIKK